MTQASKLQLEQTIGFQYHGVFRRGVITKFTSNGFTLDVLQEGSQIITQPWHNGPCFKTFNFQKIQGEIKIYG